MAGTEANLAQFANAQPRGVANHVLGLPKPSKLSNPFIDREEEVKALFNFMDTDRDGHLSLSEARHAWKLLGLDTDHDGSAVNRMLTDANRSGDLREVDCGLFVRGALLNTELTDEQLVHKAFNLADRTLSGKLDVSAMKGMVESSSESFSEEHIKDLMSVVDSTGVGEFVTVEDFYKFKQQRQKGLEWRAEKERLGLSQ